MLHFAAVIKHILYYNLPYIGVNGNTLGDLIRHIIVQICIALNIDLWACLLRKIFEDMLALIKLENNSNCNPEICYFCYNSLQSPLQRFKPLLPDSVHVLDIIVDNVTKSYNRSTGRQMIVNKHFTITTIHV